MQNPIRLLSSCFGPKRRPASDASGREPLDHPSLSGACRAFIDDLPLPAFAIQPDGSVMILSEV